MATAGLAFWGFVWYLTHNPHKELGNMTKEDIDDMADLYYVNNATAIGETKTYGNINETNTATAFTGVFYPDPAESGDAAGIAATTAPNAIAQAQYPERHRSG
jgi:hypothetical protein